MDARRHEGKEIQGLMRSLKDACGQYRNFAAGSLPESMWTAQNRGNTCKTHKRDTHTCVEAENRPQQRRLKIASAPCHGVC